MVVVCLGLFVLEVPIHEGVRFKTFGGVDMIVKWRRSTIHTFLVVLTK